MPIKRTQNRGDQEGKIKASVPYDGTQVRNNKPDKQQDTQAKKERKKSEKERNLRNLTPKISLFCV